MDMNASTKAVLIIGTLDTKGEECLYIKDRVRKEGLDGIMIDPGPLGKPAVKADISREEVAEKAGWDLGRLVRTGDKGRIIQAMTEGLKVWAHELFVAGKFHGVIAVGGGQGTAMGTAAMQVLPLGFPKVMVSTIASGDMHPFLTDIFGLNYVFRAILENAVVSLAAMTKNYRPIQEGREDPVIGATAFGVTTVGLMKMKRLFREKGFDMVLFHANGTGGRAMEEMAEAGYFDGIMDWSTHEILDEVARGIFRPGKDRLRIPGTMIMPYILAPGAIDYIVKGPFSGLSRSWKQRNHIIHNRNITLVRATAAEMNRAARFLARKLNRAMGPVKFMIPLEGFSEPNARGKRFYDPEADREFVATLKENLRNERVEVLQYEAHINDDAFVAEAVRLMTDML
jgi:uncharacterized protein (UPF0261 family)